MYKVLVNVAQSQIEGEGVFAAEDIAKGTVAWIFTQGHEFDVVTKRP